MNPLKTSIYHDIKTLATKNILSHRKRKKTNIATISSSNTLKTKYAPSNKISITYIFQKNAMTEEAYRMQISYE